MAPPKRRRLLRPVIVLVGTGWAQFAPSLTAAQAVESGPAIVADDSRIRVSTPADVHSLRARLIQFIWKGTNIPTGFSPVTAVRVPPENAKDLGTLPSGVAVERLKVAISSDCEGFAYYIVPAARKAHLVIVHAGHQNAFVGPGGLDRVVHELLSAGYSVLAVYMPGRTPEDGQGHAKAPTHYFLDTIAFGLNYIQANSRSHGIAEYQRYSMVGFSGGGWTTTVYAAVDPRITSSFPVAGSIPLYLRKTGSRDAGDAEQNTGGLYEIAGYPDLYILGSAGKGRKQVQILNANDTCCFAAGSVRPDAVPADALRGYESRVRAALSALGGSFRLEIDEHSSGHMISEWALHNIILPELGTAP